jgi:hypothetical protein
MNTFVPTERDAPPLLDIVDFKWLMAHEGHAVHVERLQHDVDYAREQFALADRSPTGALRRVAARLRAALLPLAPG